MSSVNGLQGPAPKKKKFQGMRHTGCLCDSVRIDAEDCRMRATGGLVPARMLRIVAHTRPLGTCCAGPESRPRTRSLPQDGGDDEGRGG